MWKRTSIWAGKFSWGINANNPCFWRFTLDAGPSYPKIYLVCLYFTSHSSVFQPKYKVFIKMHANTHLLWWIMTSLSNFLIFLIPKSKSETLDAKTEERNIVLNSRAAKTHQKYKRLFAVAKTFFALLYLDGFVKKEKDASSPLLLLIVWSIVLHFTPQKITVYKTYTVISWL